MSNPLPLIVLVAVVFALVIVVGLALSRRSAAKQDPAMQVAQKTANAASALTQNTAFSVVSGQIVTKDKQVHPVRVVVPTVFGGSASLLDPTPAEMSGGQVASETVDFALEYARQQYPGCEWVTWPTDIREATPDESAAAKRDPVLVRVVGEM